VVRTVRLDLTVGCQTEPTGHACTAEPSSGHSLNYPQASTIVVVVRATTIGWVA
jgi:hypothetical protein